MLRVLVADDDALIRRTLRGTLERHGHRVVEAADATECLNLMAADRLDFCIMDSAMRGPALETRLTAARSVSLPVLVLSGYENTSSDEHTGLVFQRKPMGMDAFEAALARLGFALRTADGV